MNFYKRFVADIQVKTGHLTPAEFGVYDRLLDHYYATEALLPGFERCCAIARAMTKADKDAVRRVLGEFFVPQAGDTYSQRRADEMIAEAQPKIAAARANGKRGGRPKNLNGTQQKPTGLFLGTQQEPKAKASQNQSSSTEELPPSGVQGEGKPSKRCPPSFEPSVMALVSMQEECPGLDLDREMRKFKDWEFKTAKKDWSATWRTWMRKAFDDLPKAGNETPYQRSMRERAAEIHPAIARVAPGAQKPNPMEVLDGLTVARIAG